MYLTKNLNRNLNFLVGKWKSKLPLPHFHWRHVEFPCGSSLAWLIAGVYVIPIWLWKGSPPSQVKDSSHSPLQIHIGVRWIISACFQCWLEGHLRNRFPWKSPCWRQVKLQWKNFTVVFAIISMRLGLQFSFCWNNTWWGATGVMYESHCVIPFGKPHKLDWWVKDYSKVRMCCVVLSIRC